MKYPRALRTKLIYIANFPFCSFRMQFDSSHLQGVWKLRFLRWEFDEHSSWIPRLLVACHEVHRNSSTWSFESCSSEGKSRTDGIGSNLGEHDHGVKRRRKSNGLFLFMVCKKDVFILLTKEISIFTWFKISLRMQLPESFLARKRRQNH